MDYTGLIQKFKLDRPLTEAEFKYQLKHDEKTGIEPFYFWSTIRLNSTFLEVADKFYGDKGFLTLVMLILIVLLTAGLPLACAIFWSSLTSDSYDRNAGMIGGIVCLFLDLGLLAFVIWALRKESFRQTHYPIRFNRKARMVHAFRLDGTVLSVPWDELFVCEGKSRKFMGIQYWDVRAHVLDPDGVTVRETFALPWTDVLRHLQLKGHWEYVRRYMEDENGPADTVARTPMCLPIAFRRESWSFGLMRMVMDVAPTKVFQFIMFPFSLVISPGRWIAMHTCRVPVWPEEIESACRIEPDDPYERDERDNPQDLWDVMSHFNWSGQVAPIERVS